MSAAAAMAPPLGDPRREILRAVLRKQKLLLLLVLPLVAIPTLVAMMGKPDAAWKVFGVLMLGCLQAMWWSMFPALQSQNHPNPARLVPGQLPRLREVTVGLFLLLAVLSGVVGDRAMGRGLDVMLWAGAGLLAYALAMRWPWVWVAVWFVPATTSLWRGSAAWHMLSGAMGSWQAQQPVLQAGALMLAMAVLLWHLLLAGGPAHARQWARGRLLRQALTMESWGGKAWMLRSDARGWRWLQNAFAWARPLWLDHVIRGARPTPRSALARAELVALRGVHWSTLMGAVGTVLGLAVLAALVADRLWSVPWSELLRHGSFGLFMGVMSMLVNPTLSAGTSLYQTRREQALLLLLPGMPRGQDLNRRLARRMALQFLACWTLAIALVLLVSSLPKEPADAGFGLLYAAVMLPMGLLLWRNWARQGPPRGGLLALLVLCAMLAFALITWLRRAHGVPAEAILAASAVLTLLAGWWRWRVAVQAPTAWPTGRWA